MKTVTNIVSVAVLVALAVSARAVDPPPDGGYPGGNTAEGDDALFSLTTGTDNTAVGGAALKSDKEGDGNTAIGANALTQNAAGRFNTACGAFALAANSRAVRNTALGYGAGNNITTGIHNLALGYGAGSNITSGINNIDIDNTGRPGDSGSIRIGTKGVQGATYIAGIRGSFAPSMDALPVVIDPSRHLTTVSSSARFKDDIKSMDKTSEAVLALKPVTFHYKSDAKGTPQFGLIAEEVAKVDSDLVVREENGQPYTVRYDAVNAMLLNEFLKEHHKVEAQERRAAEQDATLANQQSIIAHQQKEIDALSKGLQRVSERLSEARPVGVSNEESRE